MKLTIYRNWDTKDIGYDIGNTLGSGHNDALLVDCNSRDYRAITDMKSDVSDLREKAKERIRELLA